MQMFQMTCRRNLKLSRSHVRPAASDGSCEPSGSSWWIMCVCHLAVVQSCEFSGLFFSGNLLLVTDKRKWKNNGKKTKKLHKYIFSNNIKLYYMKKCISKIYCSRKKYIFYIYFGIYKVYILTLSWTRNKYLTNVRLLGMKSHRFHFLAGTRSPPSGVLTECTGRSGWALNSPKPPISQASCTQLARAILLLLLLLK